MCESTVVSGLVLRNRMKKNASIVSQRGFKAEMKKDVEEKLQKALERFEKK